MLKEHYANGMDPVVLGEHLKRGIETDQVYVIPYDNYYELICREQERARDFASGEGMARQEAQLKYIMENRIYRGDADVLMKKGPQVGFAKAKGDLDWVAEDRRFNK